MFSCTNTTKKDYSKDTIIKKEKSFWYFILEKYCFPQENYCFDNVGFHYDSMTPSITVNNIDEYIADSIKKVTRIKNIYPVDLYDSESDIFNQFIYFYNIVNYIKYSQDEKYVESIPIKLSYFFTMGQNKQMVFIDTLLIKNKAIMFNYDEVKVIGEILINNIENIDLKHLSVKSELDLTEFQNIYTFYSTKKEIKFDVVLKIRPYGEKKAIRI